MTAGDEHEVYRPRAVRARAVLGAGLLVVGAVQAAPPPAKHRPAAPSLGVAVDRSIHALKVPAKPEYLDAPGPGASPSATNAERAAAESADDRDAVPKREHVRWKLDYPMPGELALGRWRSAETKAIGAQATFPIPKLDLPPLAFPSFDVAADRSD